MTDPADTGAGSLPAISHRSCGPSSSFVLFLMGVPRGVFLERFSRERNVADISILNN